MPAYVLIDAHVTDPVRYQEYLKRGTAAMAKAGGRFLARGGGITRLEGEWDPGRVVVVEFRDAAAAKAWYDSPDYQAARKVRQGAARFSAVIVDGLPPA